MFLKPLKSFNFQEKSKLDEKDGKHPSIFQSLNNAANAQLGLNDFCLQAKRKDYGK